MKVTPSGPPDVRIEPHPDQGGWTIRVTQRVTKDYERVQQQRWKTDRYGFMPTSIIVGAVQCPLSLIVWPIFPGRDLWGVQRSCLRLVGLERYASDHLVDTDETIQIDHRTEDRPMPVGVVRWEWTGSTRLVHEVSLEQDGTASIRIRQLQAMLTEPKLTPEEIARGSSRLVVLQQDRELVSRPIDATDYTRIRPVERLTVLPAFQWPKAIRVRITPLDTTRKDLQFAWLSALTGYFLQRQIPVTASAVTLESIRKELQRQHGGRVADDQAVPLGRWVGATIIVTGTLETDASRIGLAVKLLDIERGTQLGTFFVEGPAESFELQLSIVKSGMDEMLRQVMRTNTPS